MSERTYVVTAATGRIGSRVARGLLAAGHQVRVMGRDRARLEPLVALGAQPCPGQVEDLAHVQRAFEGADAAFLVVTADQGVRDFRRAFADVGTVFASAAQATGLRSALFVSTIGAHDDRYRGFVLCHGDVERALDQVPGLDMLHLRAAFFSENLFYFAPASRAQGALCSPIAPDVTLDMVPTADVAEVSLQKLLQLDFRGKSSLELRGREVHTLREVAGMVERTLGRPFPARHVDREADIEAMVSAGMARDFSTWMNDTWGTFSRHGLLREPHRPAVAGATRMEDFVREQILPAFAAAA